MIPAQTPIIFDGHRIVLNHNRAAKNFSHHRFLFDLAEKDLLDRLSLIKRKPQSILIIGARSSAAFEQKLRILTGAKITYCDIDSTFLKIKKGFAYGANEVLPFETGQFDLVTGALSLHHVNDLTGFLIQIKNILRPDGIFIANMFGGETLFELRKTLMETETETLGGVSPRIAPFADKQQMGNLMQRAGFALPVIDSDLIKVSYREFLSLIHDIRGMGEGLSVLKRNNKYVGKDFFKIAAEIYKENYKQPDGTLDATFEIISLQGWAPHQSQQKPLKPGSAEVRLADALGTKEVSAALQPDHQE